MKGFLKNRKRKLHYVTVFEDGMNYPFRDKRTALLYAQARQARGERTRYIGARKGPPIDHTDSRLMERDTYEWSKHAAKYGRAWEDGIQRRPRTRKLRKKTRTRRRR